VDQQISPGVETRKEEDGSFVVIGVLRSGGSLMHRLTAECPHCHRSLSITATGPNTMPIFAQDEARRLAILEHLRADHQAKPKSETL
jgi:hypothetical protein